ncbi:MAG: flavin reductase [Candidatus Dadabacteria bacterium]|nr:MAG: flavin reductase [Candidatus Dadabacteria bacterium]
MDPDAKKTALRMIPYGLYVLTARDQDGEIAAATINWVTQASFEPSLVVAGVKRDSHSYEVLKRAGHFALNVLGKGQHDLAFTFFKPAEVDGDKISGVGWREGAAGQVILEGLPAWVVCRVVDVRADGDHAIVVGEVIDAGVEGAIEGRPDDATLWLRDLGENVFYGG